MTSKMPAEQRRQEIMEAALAEVLEKGIERTSMEGIARRARLTKGGIYHHFPSKEAVLINVNSYIFGKIGGFPELARKEEHPLRGIELYIRRYTRYWAEHPRELAFFFLSLSKLISNSVFQEQLRIHMENLLDLFGTLLKRAGFNEKEAAARGISLLAALDGIVAYLVTVPGLDPDEVTSQFVAVFLNSNDGDGKRGNHHGKS